ncbi:hypothetical protein MHW47_16470 [Streptomyces sp. OfavH-34-F]|uniref:hypothetical protein n=1 Tax=Streptomyces sp. OfavH-34-F TaxID=2917760 RepID=UPI001EF3A10C|nr:hypothetical protein [Streptomyces sp. OfavH-34-F]MCG7526031.1 hypothetical protein [Streptomyces sp. OfavH-34-F]
MTCSLALVVAAVVLDEHIGVLPGAAAVLWIGGTHAVIDRRWPVAANPGELHQMRDPYRAHAAVMREV